MILRAPGYQALARAHRACWNGAGVDGAGRSAFQRADMARHRRDRIEVAAARWLQRRTPGSALWGLIVLPPGDTRIGSMTLTVNRINARSIEARRSTARPCQRHRRHRRHRRAVLKTAGGDSGDSDGEPPRPRARGPPPRAWHSRVLKSRPPPRR